MISSSEAQRGKETCLESYGSAGNEPPVYCPQLPSKSNPVDCSLPGSSVHGILQARILSGLPCPPPGDLLGPGMESTFLMSPALADGFFTTSATWEALKKGRTSLKKKTPKIHAAQPSSSLQRQGPRRSTGKLSLHSCGHAEILSAGPQPSLLTLPVMFSSSS